MDDQLHYKNSRNNINLPASEYGTIEISTGNSIRQDFTTKIDKVTSLTLQWGTYYRENTGSALIELWDNNSYLLFSQVVDMATLIEGQPITLILEYPLENIAFIPLSLQIYGIDGLLESSATPMMTGDLSFDFIGDFYINNSLVDGRTLCFGVNGVDYIWTGLHYWKFFALGGILVLIFAFFNIRSVKQGRNNLLYSGFSTLEKYMFLIRQLIKRDFRSKYKRSILGVFWSFLNPLLTMIVQYIVFSELFRFDIQYYPVYLICGVVSFSFFTESCGMTLVSIVDNSNLITKVYMPKFVYPFTRTISSLVNLLISLIPLFVVALISGVTPTKAYFLLPIPLLFLTIFSLGVGLILCSSNVFFRDTKFLWGILSMIWMYLTPIFYPAEILPHNVAWILDFNPLNYFISFTRSLIIEGVSPEPIFYIKSAVISVLTLVIGILVFKKCEDKFVLYI